MKNTVKLLALVLLASMQACTKTEVDSAIKTSNSIEETLFSKYLKVQNAKEGSIIINSNNRNFRNKFTYEIKAGLQNPIYDEVDISGVSLIPYLHNGASTNQYVLKNDISDQSIADLFGKTLQINLKKGNLNARSDNSIYNPFSFNLNGGPRNTALSWNADNNNGKVYILILFQPNRAINENFAAWGSVERYIETDDDGFYQLTSSDFNGVPPGGNVDVLVARGRTAIIGGQTNGQSGISVQAYSSSTVTGVYGGGGGGGTGSNGPTLYVQ